MPKRLSEAEQNADPVRSRLAMLAAQAAAPTQGAAVAAPEAERPPPRTPRAVAPRMRGKGARLLQQRSGDAAFVEVRKTKFTHDEIEGNEEIVALIGRVAGSKPSQSSVTRVLWYLLRLAEDSIKGRASRAPRLKRPPNGFGIEMAEYEQELAEFLLKGIKDVEL